MESRTNNNVEALSSKNAKNNTTPNPRFSISTENKKQTSGSKKRVSDRFIPSSISKNLINEFNSKLIKANPNQSNNPNNPSKIQSTRKSDINYQKILQSEILEESTPKFDENIGSKSALDLFKINRKLKFQTEVKKVRKLRINKENSVDSPDKSLTNEKEKKIKIEKPLKSFNFKNVSDNFYLNTLDMYDINKVALGSKDGLELFDSAKDIEGTKFRDFKYDSPYEIYCVKFVNSNRLLFSDSNCNIIIKDLNKDIEMLQFNVIHRKFLTIDYMKYNENVLFLGSDNSNVDLYDLRQKNKVKNLYKHENNNEVCKIKFSSRHSLVFSGGNDNRVNIFDIRKDNLIETLKHKAAVKGLTFNDSETILATGGGTFDKTIKLWDMKKLVLLSENITDSQITNLDFLANDILVVSNGYISNNVLLYNINLDQCRNSLTSINDIVNHTNSVYPSTSVFTKISIFDKHLKRILYMSKSRCNNYLSTCSTDGNLRIWKVNKFLKTDKFADEALYYGIR